MTANSHLFLVGFLCLLTVMACRPEPDPTPEPVQNLSKNIKVIEDEFQGVPIVLAGSGGNNFIVSFKRTLTDGTPLNFVPSMEALPVIMEDNTGSTWNIFGEAVSGPLQGEKLSPVNSYMGYWFAFGAFFPGVEIYQHAQNDPMVSPPPPSPGWLLSTDQIFSGSVKDAIPAIDEPKTEIFRSRNYIETPHYLQDQDLVIGIKIGDSVIAYPHPILNWHEIVNEERDGRLFSIIYCPLTGTGMAWDRIIDGQVTTFGVSGLLHNNNVMPYDRNTESIWSQMRGDCVNGSLINSKASHIQVVETTWETWQLMYPQPTILSDDTGIARDYTDFPYGSYRTNHELLPYPINYDDARLDRKERVHGIIIEGEAKVYRLSDF